MRQGIDRLKKRLEEVTAFDPTGEVSKFENHVWRARARMPVSQAAHRHPGDLLGQSPESAMGQSSGPGGR